MLGIVQGIAIVLRPTPAGVIAPSLGQGFEMGIWFIPTPFLVLSVLAIALEVWLYRSRNGLALRGVGFNAESTRRVGWTVGTIRSIALLVCALAQSSAESSSPRRLAWDPTTLVPATPCRASQQSSSEEPS